VILESPFQIEQRIPLKKSAIARLLPVNVEYLFTGRNTTASVAGYRPLLLSYPDTSLARTDAIPNDLSSELSFRTVTRIKTKRE
jgi:hypothetical protein